MLNDKSARAWEVFRRLFKDGDAVIIEDDCGDFYWGTLLATDSGITLTRPNGKSVTVDWDDVLLIAHDGFPIAPLRGMTQRLAASLAKKTNQQIIECLVDWRPPEPTFEPIRLGGGCPFVAGPMTLAAVHNLGNRGPRWWFSEQVEILEFVAPNGAAMHSYDTEHLFMLPEMSAIAEIENGCKGCE